MHIACARLLGAVLSSAYGCVMRDEPMPPCTRPAVLRVVTSFAGHRDASRSPVMHRRSYQHHPNRRPTRACYHRTRQPAADILDISRLSFTIDTQKRYHFHPNRRYSARTESPSQSTRIVVTQLASRSRKSVSITHRIQFSKESAHMLIGLVDRSLIRSVGLFSLSNSSVICTFSHRFLIVASFVANDSKREPPPDVS